jgi:hypothetical protein
MKHELAMLSRSPHSDVSPYSSVLAVLPDRRKTSRQPSVAPSIRQRPLGAGHPSFGTYTIEVYPNFVNVSAHLSR